MKGRDVKHASLQHYRRRMLCSFRTGSTHPEKLGSPLRIQRPKPLSTRRAAAGAPEHPQADRLL